MESLSSAAVVAGLRARSERAFDEALAAAVTMGAEGDRILAGMGNLKGWRLTLVVAALGYVNGPHGGAFLRQIVATTGPGTSDKRCAAMLALTKREREKASDVLAAALGDPDAGVRDYALLGLAAYGDGRAWDAVLARLKTMTARQRTREADLSGVVVAVIYLLRCSKGDDARVEAVRSLLVRRFRRLTETEQEWVAEHRPAAAHADASSPADEGAPDPEALHRWLLTDPLFRTRW